jgi:hypothetical protein
MKFQTKCITNQTNFPPQEEMLTTHLIFSIGEKMIPFQLLHVNGLKTTKEMTVKEAVILLLIPLTGSREKNLEKMKQQNLCRRKLMEKQNPANYHLARERNGLEIP